MQKSKACLQIRQGSILAYSLIILAMMVAIVATMSIATVVEKKSASSTDFSVQAYQIADSGVQQAIKKINANRLGLIKDVLTTDCNPCDDGGNVKAQVSCSDAGPGTYILTFFSDSAGTNVIIDCDASVGTIRNIESVGTYNNTVRAVSVAVN